MRSLEVVLTTWCNLRCSYCYQGTRRDLRRMGWETLRRALDLLVGSASPRPRLSFYGGEPLLEFPSIRRAVGYLDEALPAGRTARYAITTNGTLLDDGVAEFLAEHRFTVHLSLDGVASAQDLRSPGTFERLDALLDRLRSRHPTFFRRHLRVVLTLTQDNLPYLAESVRYLLGRDVREIEIAPLITGRALSGPGLREELEHQFSRIHRMTLDHQRETGQVPVALLRRSAEDEAPGRNLDRFCGVDGGESLTVDVDGRLYGCVLFAPSLQDSPSDFFRRQVAGLCFGDLNDGKPTPQRRAAVVPGPIFSGRLQKYSSFGRCGECEFVEDCHVCPVSIAHIPANTDHDRIPDLQCALHLVALDYRRRVPPVASVRDVVRGRAPVPGAIRRVLDGVGRTRV